MLIEKVTMKKTAKQRRVPRQSIERYLMKLYPLLLLFSSHLNRDKKIETQNTSCLLMLDTNNFEREILVEKGFVDGTPIKYVKSIFIF